MTRNIHVIQTFESRAEVMTIMNANNRIRTPQRNAPNTGIIQDGLVGSYLLTDSRCKVEWQIVFDCVMSAGLADRWEDFMLRAEDYFPRDIQNGRCIGEGCGGKLLFSVLLPHDLFYERENGCDENEPVVKIEKGILIEAAYK